MKKNLNIAYLNGADIGKKVINVTETINNQDKYIEITENGSVEVVADSGYTGLGKVTVNVEVASSGGGSSGGGEASTIEYLDVSGITPQLYPLLCSLSILVKFTNNIVPSGLFIVDYVSRDETVYNSVGYIAVDFNSQVKIEGDMTTIGSIMQYAAGVTQEQLDAIPRITKEQFYSLE